MKENVSNNTNILYCPKNFYFIIFKINKLVNSEQIQHSTDDSQQHQQEEKIHTFQCVGLEVSIQLKINLSRWKNYYLLDYSLLLLNC